MASQHAEAVIVQAKRIRLVEPTASGGYGGRVVEGHLVVFGLQSFERLQRIFADVSFATFGTCANLVRWHHANPRHMALLNHFNKGVGAIALVASKMFHIHLFLPGRCAILRASQYVCHDDKSGKGLANLTGLLCRECFLSLAEDKTQCYIANDAIRGVLWLHIPRNIPLNAQKLFDGFVLE